MADIADSTKHHGGKKPATTKSVTCSRCSRPSKSNWYDSNGLCVRCNFNKMMGGEVV